MNITHWVDSSASGSNDGTSYANAWTSLSSATSVAAGSVIGLVYTSSETPAGVTYNFTNSTVTSPITIITVDSSGNYTQATSFNVDVSIGGYDITFTGYLNLYGLKLKVGDDVVFDTTYSLKMENCYLDIGSTLGSNKNLQMPSGYYYGTTTLRNNTINCGTYYSGMIFKDYGILDFVGNTFQGTIPYYGTIYGTHRGGINRFTDEDLSAVSTAILSGSISSRICYEFNRCKLPSGVSALSGSITHPDGILRLSSCDVGDGYHYFMENYYHGDIEESTSVYRTASDAKYNGTNGYSAEFIPNSNTSELTPLEFCIYNGYIDTGDYTTTVTFTVHFALQGTTTALNEEDFYIYVEYPDGADNSLGVISSTKLDPISTGSAHSTTSSAWTIGATNVQMYESLSVTIGTSAGNIASGPVRIFAGITTALGGGETLYVDPGVVIT